MSNIQARQPTNPHAKPEPVNLQHFNARKAQILTRVPPWIRPEKFEGALRTAFFEGGDMLARVTPESFLYAVSSCAELGLVLGKTAGHAYLVPFRNECTLIVGYKGLIFLAYRAGLIKAVDLHAVYRGQEFQCWMENNEWKNRHIPFGEVSTKDSDITHVYCIMTLANGAKKFSVMTRDQIEEIRARAPSGNSPSWRNSWGEMAKKTVLRRAMKTLPMDADCEINKALKLEDEAYDEPQQIRKPYMQQIAEANTIEIERLDAIEKSHNRETMMKYIEIAAKKGINLGKTQQEIEALDDKELAILLAKTEELLNA